MHGAGRVNPLHSTGLLLYIAQKMKFSIKDFFSKCDQIRNFLWIWPHLLKKSFMENFIFCAVIPTDNMRKPEVLTHVFLGV